MTLDRLLADHRAMYRAELGIRMTSRAVPADTETIVIKDEMVEVTDSGPLGGAPFSLPMVRRLGPGESFGATYPWAHSWSWLRRACRNDHPGHLERPEFGGSLCWQVVSWAVISDLSPDQIAGVLEMPVEDVERHLKNALRWIEEDIDRKQRIRNAKDPQPSEEPTPSRLSLLVCDAANRAVQDFDLEERIWESQRRLQPDLNLPSWESEWSRRLQLLWAHQRECDRCRRAA